MDLLDLSHVLLSFSLACGAGSKGLTINKSLYARMYSVITFHVALLQIVLLKNCCFSRYQLKWEKTGSWAIRVSLRLNSDVLVTFVFISFLGSRLLCPGEHSASRCRINYCHFDESDSLTYTHAFSTH